MAVYNKFQSWSQYLTTSANVSSDQFTAFLTNTAPVATNTVIANISQISYTNLSGTRNFTTTSATQTSGTLALKLNALTFTATGTVPDFQYYGIYDGTVSGSPLVCWFDYGSVISMVTGNTLIPLKLVTLSCYALPV